MRNTNSLDDLDFEDATREKKGAATEDSGLKILATLTRKYKFEIQVIERVAPIGIGEFDAICCTDSGLIVVELKRYGGCFWPFKILDEQVCIQSGKVDKYIPNPAFKLHQKVERMRKELMDKDGAWLPVKRLFSGDIRIHKLVCFGPSTKFDELPEPTKNTSICTTRTLSRTIEDIFSTKVGVIGAGAQMATLASIWPRWGVLTTHKKGFLRSALSKISTSDWDITPYGIESLGSDGRSLQYQFSNGRKGKLPFDEEVWIKTFVEGQERSIPIEPGTRFRWRIKGK